MAPIVNISARSAPVKAVEEGPVLEEEEPGVTEAGETTGADVVTVVGVTVVGVIVVGWVAGP
ncbi:MAG TPA: hypothetical protein VIJ56_05000 [Acidimicrobiales bacterium]